MHELRVRFNKTARSGYFYHADEYECDALEMRKPPVAAKRGNRIKLWITNADGVDDITLRINDVEEVAEHEKDDLYQIYTDDATWEQIVGVPKGTYATKLGPTTEMSDEQRAKLGLPPKGYIQQSGPVMLSEEEKASRKRHLVARTGAYNRWQSRGDRDHCIETGWETNTSDRGGGPAFWGTNRVLPEWIGEGARLGLSRRQTGGGQQCIFLYNAAERKRAYTLRINNIWVYFAPMYGRGEHYNILVPDDYFAIADYAGGDLPNENPPPRDNYEIGWAAEDFGMNYSDYALWRLEAREIQGLTFGLATCWGQRNHYEESRADCQKAVVRLEPILRKYQQRYDALERAGVDENQDLLRKIRGLEQQLEGPRRGIETCNERISQMQASYDENLVKYERLIARREFWEEGVHPDEVIPLPSAGSDPVLPVEEEGREPVSDVQQGPS